MKQLEARILADELIKVGEKLGLEHKQLDALLKVLDNFTEVLPTVAALEKVYAFTEPLVNDAKCFDEDMSEAIDVMRDHIDELKNKGEKNATN